MLTHRHDVALLKTSTKVPQNQVIRMCTEPPRESTLLATCGMGRIFRSRSNHRRAPVLQELYLQQRPPACWEYDDPEMILTQRLGRDLSGNICHGDSGSPLYTIDVNEFGFTGPNCVYGVASHTGTNLYDFWFDCNGGSYFASVPFYYEWIWETMQLN